MAGRFEGAGVSHLVMTIFAIDPGQKQSAWLRMENGRVADKGIQPNEDLKNSLIFFSPVEFDAVAIEMVACYGMAVGAETFQTVLWIGRFCERSPIEPRLVYRKDVKMHLCHSMRAKDANVRQAILDRFGGKDEAMGRKASPGPLYGVSSHVWSALAIALFIQDTA